MTPTLRPIVWNKKVLVKPARNEPDENKVGPGIWRPAEYKTEPQPALFHCFQMEGAGEDLTVVAVIEYPEGTIDTPSASQCQFTDRKPYDGMTLPSGHVVITNKA